MGSSHLEREAEVLRRKNIITELLIQNYTQSIQHYVHINKETASIEKRPREFHFNQGHQRSQKRLNSPELTWALSRKFQISNTTSYSAEKQQFHTVLQLIKTWRHKTPSISSQQNSAQFQRTALLRHHEIDRIMLLKYITQGKESYLRKKKTYTE